MSFIYRDNHINRIRYFPLVFFFFSHQLLKIYLFIIINKTCLCVCVFNYKNEKKNFFNYFKSLGQTNVGGGEGGGGVKSDWILRLARAH